MEHEPSVCSIICGVAYMASGMCSSSNSLVQQQSAKQQAKQMMGDNAIRTTTTIIPHIFNA